MKKNHKNNNFRQIIYILLLAAVLFFSNLSAFAGTDINTKTQNIINNDLFKLPSEPIDEPQGYEVVIEEDFSDGNMPPEGDWGTWEHIITNPDDETWFIDSSNPHSEPYCATIRRGDSDEIQDEWLITPTIDFSDYSNEILLEFYFYTEYYITSYMDYNDLNVSISTDGGTSWTKIWTEDNIGYFPTWNWEPTRDYIPIDISAYGGESNVKIAFQYYCNCTNESDYQEYSIDDIVVIAEGDVKFDCSLGGPYEWWWPMQFEYDPPGVRFHGSVEPFGIGYRWLWDFEDGNTSTLPYIPIHFFAEANRTYNVTLTVTDNSYDPPRYAFNYTDVTIFLLPPPDLDINIQKISLGIKAEIENVCEYNATYVNWSMKLGWGPRQMFERIIANDTIERIPPKSATGIQSRLYFFGFGFIHIEISAEPENFRGVIEHFEALKIGPFVFVFGQQEET